MGNFKEILLLDGISQAELIRKKEIKPSELLESTIESIEQLNPKLNAVVTKMYDLAEESINKKEVPDGPFKGVPFLIKDLLAEY